jgi:indolepyruvate ferredoxin oxidoreductase beta subunit
MIVNNQEVPPMPVITGAADYPENILGKLREAGDEFGFDNMIFIDALRFAREAGNAKAVNVVLIGVMAKNTEIPYEEWVETIKTTVPPKFLEANLKAFDLGYNL